MAKCALFVTVAACLLLRNPVLGAKRSKRQSCDITELPSACLRILSSTIADATFADPTSFTNNYCGDTCGQLLYNYFKDCDAGSNNATMFDFFCSSNAAGEQCLQQILSAVSAEDSVFFECLNPIQGTTCNATCESALAAANESLGCCLFSYYAVTGGLSGANVFFDFCGEDLKTLCVGGVSGQTLQFPTPAVDPECEEFVDDVDESCRYLLDQDPIVIAISDLDGFCGNKCGPELYQYYRYCDGRTEGNSSVYSDVLCARNSENKLCGELLFNFDNMLNFEACDALPFTCPAECSTALQQGQATFGCCLQSLLQLVSGVNITQYAPKLCKMEINSNCLGGFSEKPASPPATELRPTPSPTTEPTRPASLATESIEKPTSMRCGSLFNAIPAMCQNMSSFHLISNLDGFNDRFCKGNCAKPVFEHINECVNTANATYIDYMCSQTPSGTQCVNILRDETLGTVFEGVCRNATDKQCSQQCHIALEGFAKTYGCCLFTYYALNTNVTYSNGLYAQCMIHNPGLCTGGISNAEINAPGSEVKKGAAYTVFSSIVLLIQCLAFTLTI